MKPPTTTTPAPFLIQAGRPWSSSDERSRRRLLSLLILSALLSLAFFALCYLHASP